MANVCYYEMKIMGRRESVQEMVDLMAGTGPYQGEAFGRVFSFELEGPIEKTDKEGVYSALGSGDCAWSIVSSMQKEAGYSRSLEEESKRLNLAIEAYSSEPGIGFQEHVLIANGVALIEDCIDYEEHVIDGYPGGLKDYNRDHSTDFTEQQVNHNGEVCIGGIPGAFDDYSRVEQAAAGLLLTIHDHEKPLDTLIKEAKAKAKATHHASASRSTLQETPGTPFLEPGEDLNQRVTKADWETFRKENPQARIEHLIMRGDVIATDLVHHLVSEMGPGIYDPLKETLLQMGSPYDFQINERGKVVPRFFTLARAEDTWHYQGHCFAGEREERADAVYYEPRPILRFTDEAGRQEHLSLNVCPSVDAGDLCITANHLIPEAGLMDSYSDVTFFLKSMPYLQATISPDDIETGLVGWLDENGFGQIIGTCEDELGFTYVVYAFDEDKLKGIDPLCFDVYRDAAQVKHYYFTFGSSEHFPYQGGCVEIQAQSREEAVRLFRSHYPDRLEGIINCAFIYDQNEWDKTTASRSADHNCHCVITAPGPYEVTFMPENEERSLQHLMAEAKESASDKNKHHAEQQHDSQAPQTKTPSSQER